MYNNGSSERERGAVIIFFAIVLIPLLAIVGLAIDSGNLYRARLALQVAADATALAAVNNIALRGRVQFEKDIGIHAQNLTDDKKQEEINKHLQNIGPKGSSYVIDLGLANMAAAGYPHVPGKYDVTVTPTYFPGSLSGSADSAYDVEVTIRRRIDYLLMDVLPFFSQGEQEISATARSRRRIAFSSIMLDCSASVACPAQGSCACKNSAGGCPQTGRKYDKLLEGVASFLKMFDIDRDVLYLVPFNSAAFPRSVKQFKDSNGYQGAEVTEELIDELVELFSGNYVPGGPTNVCDALMRAHASIEAELSSRGLSDREVGYVLFSDGAPTAGRFLFKNPDGLVPYNNMGPYDYVHHSIAWKTGDDIFTGPGLLFPSGYFGFGCLEPTSEPQIDPITKQQLHCGRDADPAAIFSKCDDGGISKAPKITSLGQISNAAKKVFSPCLNNFEAHLPGKPEVTYGKEIPFKDWRKMYYHCALEMADEMRRNQGVLYAVGLGDSKPLNTGNDPYEDLNEVNYRKDVFLSRVALDPTVAAKQVSGNQVIEFDYPGHKSYEDWSAAAPDREGVYFPTANADDIKMLFHKIARTIMLRLVS